MKSTTEGEKFIKKIIIFLTLVIFVAACKGVGPKPPQPVLTIDGQEISYKLLNYTWKDNGKLEFKSPFEMVEGMEYIVLEPSSQVNINFDNEPEFMTGGIWQDYNGATLEEIKNNTIILPEEKGKYIYFFSSYWSDEDEADFMFSFEIK